MTTKLFALTEDQWDGIKRELAALRALVLNPRRGLTPEVPEHQASDLYVAWVPSTIPGAGTHGTGTGATSVVPGTASLRVYAAYPDGHGGYLVGSVSTLTVLALNFSTSAVVGPAFVEVARDKFGNWVVAGSGGGGSLMVRGPNALNSNDGPFSASLLQFGDSGDTNLGGIGIGGARIVPNATPITNGLVSGSIPVGGNPLLPADQTFYGPKRFAPVGGIPDAVPPLSAQTAAYFGSVRVDTSSIGSTATQWDGSAWVVTMDGPALGQQIVPGVGTLDPAGLLAKYVSGFPDGSITTPFVLYARTYHADALTCDWEPHTPFTTGAQGGVVAVFDPTAAEFGLVPTYRVLSSSPIPGGATRRVTRYTNWEVVDSGMGAPAYVKRQGIHGKLVVVVGGVTYPIQTVPDAYSGDGNSKVAASGGIVYASGPGGGVGTGSTIGPGTGTGTGGGGGGGGNKCCGSDAATLNVVFGGALAFLGSQTLNRQATDQWSLIVDAGGCNNLIIDIICGGGQGYFLTIDGLNGIGPSTPATLTTVNCAPLHITGGGTIPATSPCTAGGAWTMDALG